MTDIKEIIHKLILKHAQALHDYPLEDIYISGKIAGLEELLNILSTVIPIENLNFSVRSYNCCKRAGYNYLSDFYGKTKYDLMRIRNLGQKNMDEIIAICKENGITINNDEE